LHQFQVGVGLKPVEKHRHRLPLAGFDADEESIGSA
jgi:hypothetical protein